MIRLGTACFALIGTGALGLAATDSVAPGGDGTRLTDTSHGKTLFDQNCSRCHGFNMMNPAPGVFDLRTFPLKDKTRFVDSVSNGKGAMPAWKAVLTAEEIESLWTYVNSSRPP